MVAALRSLEGTLDETTMTAMNARVELDGRGESEVAAEFLAERQGIRTEIRDAGRRLRDIARYALEHLNMVAVSLVAAVLVAIPLGIVAARRTELAQPILGVVGIIRTIPSIALLVLLIRPISYVSDELGYPQAVVALFLYSLLPIVRNTHAGLRGGSRHSCRNGGGPGASTGGAAVADRVAGLGVPDDPGRREDGGGDQRRLRDVGRLHRGGRIRRADLHGHPSERLRGGLLQGAIPAAVLALLVQGLFELVDRMVVPRGPRLRPVA